VKEYAESFYKSVKWQRCRDAYFLSQQGICERCMNPGKIVHHKTYITPLNIGDVNITLNPDNLELLCIVCHNKEHFSNKCYNAYTEDGKPIWDNINNKVSKDIHNTAVNNINIIKGRDEV